MRVRDLAVYISVVLFLPVCFISFSPLCSLQEVATVEKPEVCGEKVFSQTTKTLLQRYKQTSYHALHGSTNEE